LIITHLDSAHFDEVAAVSLILAVHADTVFRIEQIKRQALSELGIASEHILPLAPGAVPWLGVTLRIQGKAVEPYHS